MSPSTAFPSSCSSPYPSSSSSSYILGIGTAFPAHLTKPADLETFARKWCDENEGLEKTLLVNNNTKILTRPMVQTTSSPLINAKLPPKIKAVNEVFMDKGVELAVLAAKRALEDWGGKMEEITHLVCTTCTASSYPGYDHAVLLALGLNLGTDRTLLHGVGCAGGLSALRLAHSLARVPPDHPSDRPPRILVIAAEVTSTLCRSEIDELSRADDGRANVSICLFSDGASGMVVGGARRGSSEVDDGVAEGQSGPGLVHGLNPGERASFEVLGCVTETVPGTQKDLGFNVDEYGWKAVISSKVPGLASKAIAGVYSRLLSSRALVDATEPHAPIASFLSTPPSSTPYPSLDWLVHTGGSLIISKLEQTLGLSSKDHTVASWDIYKNKGNSSSVSIGAVIENSRGRGGRDGCIAVSFGPGVTVEMALLRRTGWRGKAATGDEVKVNDSNGGLANGHASVNGVNGHSNGLNEVSSKLTELYV